MPGLRVSSAEDGAEWSAYFADLVARGLAEVRLVTSDVHRGLVAAIGGEPVGAGWQRCCTHYAVNLTSITPESSWTAVEAHLHSVCDQPDAAAVRAQFERVLDQLELNELDAVAAHLEAAREDLLTFAAFPTRGGTSSGRINPQERLNKEIRRRTDVVGDLPRPRLPGAPGGGGAG